MDHNECDANAQFTEGYGTITSGVKAGTTDQATLGLAAAGKIGYTSTTGALAGSDGKMRLVLLLHSRWGVF